MHSVRVDVVSLLLGSVKKREREREREREKEKERESVTQPFILPGKVIRAEWHKPSPLVENIKSKLQRPKIIPAPDNEFENTGWNDKIAVLKKTTLQLYFKTFIEKINSGNLIML